MFGSVFIALMLVLMAPSVYAEGLFERFQRYPISSYPSAVDIGDVSNDGRNDVVMVSGFFFYDDNYTVFIYPQKSDGRLDAPIKIATRGTYHHMPRSVAVDDINNDGRNDIIVALCGLGLEIFYQGESGVDPASSFIETTNACVVKTGQLNGDDLTDIVSIGWESDKATVITQNSDGTLASPVNYTAFHGGYDDMAVGDVNNDDRSDIIVMSGQMHYPDLSVLLQNSDGGFSEPYFYDVGLNEFPHGVTTGDMDNDGLNDVVISYGITTSISDVVVFYQNQNGLLNPATSYPGEFYPQAIQSADIDGDHRDDIVVTHGDVSRVGVYASSWGGMAAPVDLYEIPYSTHIDTQAMALGDINGDESPDIAIAHLTSGLVVLLNANAINQPPVADAGQDMTVCQNDTVYLDGSGSNDPDGTITRFDWTRISGPVVVLSNTPTAGVVTFTAPEIQPGESTELIFELTVTNETGYTASDRIVVTLNQPPVAVVAAPKQTVVQRTIVTLDGSASYDPNNPIADLTWNQLSGPVAPLTVAGSPAVVQFEAPRLKNLKTAELKFELTVTDESGESDTAFATIKVIKR